MKLLNVAKFFDKTVCVDAYDPAVTFKGQIDPFVMFTVDAARVKRRMFSTAPDVVMPARGAIRVDDQVYLVGDNTDDHWEGRNIRRNYVLLGADDLATIRTIPQALAELDGLEAYALREWTRTEDDSRESAERFSSYSIFLNSDEPVMRGHVIEIRGDYYYVHEVRKSHSGLADAMSSEIQGPVFETVDFSSRVYEPISDTYTKTTNAVRVMRLRWDDGFKYLTKASTDYERGDELIMVLHAFVPQPETSDLIELSDGNYKVVSVRDNGLYWTLQVRRD